MIYSELLGITRIGKIGSELSFYFVMCWVVAVRTRITEELC